MVTTAELQDLLADPAVVRVDPLRYGSAALAESVAQIRADAVHRRGDLGSGVTVAVLDTGIDSTHPDLAGHVLAEECFCTDNCCPAGTARQSGPGSAQNTAAHGIHVAGIIAGSGVVAPTGVAPGAKLVAIKVLNQRNRGPLDDWIAALDWIAVNRPDVQAINMSLVSDEVFQGACDAADSYTMAFAQVLETLRARSTVTFAAAGNGGEISAMAAPACVSGALSVGAVERDDQVWFASDSEPTLDLLAPGVDVVSSGPDASTATLTGTSMATAHATGAAALLLALNPGLGADQLEAILEERGVRVLDTRNGLTFPRLNALSAMNAVLNVTQPFLGNGSRRHDCLVEWDVPLTTARTRPISGGMCRDGDPSCDTDQTAGQCRLGVSVCFNVYDRRLPECATHEPIVSHRASSLRAGDAIDVANAAALSAVLPPVPIVGETVCTNRAPFIVPAGQTRTLRFTARAGDGRRDHDRLRLRCE
jgi:hypothetical protein